MSIDELARCPPEEEPLRHAGSRASNSLTNPSVARLHRRALRRPATNGSGGREVLGSPHSQDRAQAATRPRSKMSFTGPIWETNAWCARIVSAL